MSTDDPDADDLPPAVRETLDSLGGALGDIAELDKEQLNETIGLLETLGHDQAAGILHSRREVLKGAGAATGLGIAGLAGATATGGARAQSDTQSGTIGNGNQDADVQDVSAESVSTGEINTTKHVSPDESIQSVIDEGIERTRIVLESGYHTPANPITITGSYWVLEFEAGARIASEGTDTNLGNDAGIGDYAIKVQGARTDNLNWEIRKPQICNAEGGVYVEGGAFFDISSPQIFFGQNDTGVGIGIDRANTFTISGAGRFNGQSGTDSRCIQLGTIPDPGDNTTAVNFWEIGPGIGGGSAAVGVQLGADSGRGGGSGSTRSAFGGTISSDIENCEEGLVVTNGRGLQIEDAWFEANDIAIHFDSNGSFTPSRVKIEQNRFASNTQDIVQDGTFIGGPLIVGETNDTNPSVDVNGGFATYARLPQTPNSFNTGVGGVYLINDMGEETADAEEPQLSNWPTGATVDFTDSGDGSGTGIYQLLVDGTWVQIGG